MTLPAQERTFASTLNGICPYFTMFPLDFPLGVLRNRARRDEWVLDPFCGRGTTNFASRLMGVPTLGIDSSSVAVALAEAKLANVNAHQVLEAANQILEEMSEHQPVPQGEFWSWAFHPDVLQTLCRLRQGLLEDSRSDARKALRALILGALHGPLAKSRLSYFSNQSQRTYAPKPRYAVKFWSERNLFPQPVDVMEILARRAQRFYGEACGVAIGKVIRGDSTRKQTFESIPHGIVSWVITSPPYYGMKTYLSDQWLRYWFLGGPPVVDYAADRQMQHSTPTEFANQLRQVWQNVERICSPGAHLVIRYGGINDRKADPMSILDSSLDGTAWKVDARVPAGSAAEGRRQALHFAHRPERAIDEYDVWAVLRGG